MSARTPRPGPAEPPVAHVSRVPSPRGVVWSALASAYAVTAVHGTIVVLLLTSDPGRRSLLFTAGLALVAAVCCFCAASVAGYVRNSLAVAAWGYAPGLAWVVVGCVVLAQAREAAGGAPSPWLIGLVLADPLVWVPVCLAVGVALGTRRRGGLSGLTSA